MRTDRSVGIQKCYLPRRPGVKRKSRSGHPVRVCEPDGRGKPDWAEVFDRTSAERAYPL